MLDENKKLYRSKTDRLLWGVCGGLGEFYDIDSTIIRIAWVAASLISSGFALLLYVIAAIIMPKKEKEELKHDENENSSTDRGNFEKEKEECECGREKDVCEEGKKLTACSKKKNIIGIILILVGLLALMNMIFPRVISFQYFLPLLIIFSGIAIIQRGWRKL